MAVQSMPPMRRRDRQVTDRQRIRQIIEACQILRLGLADGEYPYIVPVNFAYEIQGEQLFLYIHGAMAGRKYALLRQHPACSFEMDTPLQLECLPEKGDVTMRYRSVMGTAIAEPLEGAEKQDSIDRVIMARYPATRDFAYNRAAVARTAVFRLRVTALSAKENLPASGADL